MPTIRGSRWNLRALLLVTTMAAAAGCRSESTVLMEQTRARQVASELHVAFVRASDASDRAVLADTDEASTAAAREATQARDEADQALQRLEPMLTSLGYADESRAVTQFAAKFGEYKTLDAEILPLAVENTNLKAQRLSFGAGQDAAASIFAALDRATTGHEASPAAVADAAACRVAVLTIQVIQARHIAESDEAVMTRLEGEMAAAERSARAALDRLGRRAPTGAALAGLDRFMDVNRQIVALSRRNSNVRSLALTLGRKRTVAAECDDQLRLLEAALGRHDFAATR
jgi:hypothetical protein